MLREQERSPDINHDGLIDGFEGNILQWRPADIHVTGIIDQNIKATVAFNHPFYNRGNSRRICNISLDRLTSPTVTAQIPAYYSSPVWRLSQWHARQ